MSDEELRKEDAVSWGAGEPCDPDASAPPPPAAGPAQNARDEQARKDEEDKQNKKKRRRRNIIIAIVAAALVIIGLAVGIPYYIYTLSHKSTDDAFIAGYVTNIAPRVSGHVQRVCVQDNQWVEAGEVLLEIDPRDYQARVNRDAAALTAANASELYARVNLAYVRVTSASDLADAQAGVELAASGVTSAAAGVEAAKSVLQQSQAGVKVQQSGAQQADSQVQVAQAQHEYDQATLKRNEEMYKGHAITAQQLDQVRTQARVSEAQLQAAQKSAAAAASKTEQARAAEQTDLAQLAKAQAMLDQAKAQLKQAQARLQAAETEAQKIALADAQWKQAQAQVKQAQASLDEARLQRSYTRVVAPRHGHITNKTVRRGEFVQPGQTLLAVVAPEVWVVANYKETSLTHMRPGQPVSMTVDAFPGQSFHGHVDSIQAGTGAQFSLLPPENATGNYIKVVQRVPVKILFDDLPDPAKTYLVPGMSVVPTVNIGAGANAPADEPYTAASHRRVPASQAVVQAESGPQAPQAAASESRP